MKKYFFTGLVLILPLTVTVILLVFVLDLLTEPFVGMVKDLFLTFKHQLGPLTKHPKLLLFIGRVTVLLLMLISIFFLGFLGRRFFFKYLHEKMNAILERIPIVRRVYRITREITKSVLSGDKKPFGKPVYIPFPHTRSVAIGFETGHVPKEAEMEGIELRSVFIPTAPHPISGFVLLTRKDDISPLDISAEEILKFLVSCGTYHFEEKNAPGHADSSPKQPPEAS
ncbi:MAG: DUF502 domain-containing protein [Chlamydiales bacterium]|nr:DUF502 domain-containing protein [Chlamydiales bacterium]